MKSIDKYRNFKQVLNYFYEEEMHEGEKELKSNKIEYNNVRLVPSLYLDKVYNKMIVEFKVGKEQLYKLKSLPDFYTRVKDNSSYKYGNSLEFIHNEDNFDKDSREI